MLKAINLFKKNQNEMSKAKEKNNVLNTNLNNYMPPEERYDLNGNFFSLENFSLNNPMYSENKGAYDQTFQPKYSANKAFNPSNGYGGNFRKENDYGNGQVNPFMNGDVNYNLYYQQQQGFYPKGQQPWVYNPSTFSNTGYNTYVDSDKTSNGKYTCKFEIQIENDKEFQVARRIIGSKVKVNFLSTGIQYEENS